MESHLPNSGIYVQCRKQSPLFPRSCYFNEDPHVYNYIAMYNKYGHNSIIILLICHSYSKSELGEYYDWSSKSWLMRQSNAAWMSKHYADSLGHLVSVNATTPRASQHALTGLGAANCHIPGKLWSKLFDLSHCT